MRNDRGFFEALVGDGRPLLMLTGLCLIFSGLFALFLSATGHFLPHDIQYLGMEPKQLCAINECRIVHFMIHDRVSFGGALIAIGALYLWLAEFPLREGKAWPWLVFLLSGLTGFGSFLAYLGYGYLDTWHGSATLALLPCFAIGMIRSASGLTEKISIRSLWQVAQPTDWKSSYGVGRAFLLATSGGLILGGATIMLLGMTTVFVPTDLDYMGLPAERLQAINPNLVPLIAHDRAGFGGAICTSGVLMFFCVWCGRPSKSLWQVLLVAGGAGFAAAIGVHPIIGYTAFIHLAPAVLGASIFLIGIALTFKKMCVNPEPRT